jgi:hypothetical protein
VKPQSRLRPDNPPCHFPSRTKVVAIVGLKADPSLVAGSYGEDDRCVSGPPARSECAYLSAGGRLPASGDRTSPLPMEGKAGILADPPKE